MQIPKDSYFMNNPIVAARQKLAAESAQTPGFVEMLAKGVSNVSEMQMSSRDQIDDLLSGKEINSAEVMTGIQKADMSFRLLVQIRNKLMKAFEELNSIRV